MQLKELSDKKYNKVIDYLLSQLIPYYQAIHLELTVHYG